MRMWMAAALAMGAAQPARADAPDAEALSPALPPIMSLREQARLRDAWTRERLDTIVPRLMREAGVDLWVLVAREYAEDPVVLTMLDAASFPARRRTILVFHDPGGGRPVERRAVTPRSATG